MNHRIDCFTILSSQRIYVQAVPLSNYPPAVARLNCVIRVSYTTLYIFQRIACRASC
nr:MAG TPA: hypothetical protein [Caudoviricetes sp.]